MGAYVAAPRERGNAVDGPSSAACRRFRRCARRVREHRAGTLSAAGRPVKVDHGMPPPPSTCRHFRLPISGFTR